MRISRDQKRVGLLEDMNRWMEYVLIVEFDVELVMFEMFVVEDQDE